jgi:hypothetical protein
VAQHNQTAEARRSEATSELKAAKARYAAIRAQINAQPAGKPLTVDEELEEQFAREDVLRAMYPEAPR